MAAGSVRGPPRCGLREIEASLKRPQEVAAKAKAILESLPPPTPAPAAPAD